MATHTPKPVPLGRRRFLRSGALAGAALAAGPAACGPALEIGRAHV